jgi:phosphoglycerate kinase
MPIQFKKLTDLTDLRGKRVLLRLDLNVPIVGEEVRDDFRIQRALPTLQFLKDAGAKTIVIAHIENELTDSLGRVAAYVSKLIEVKAFVSRLADAPIVVSALKEGEIIILENLRTDPGEKDNGPGFAARLASLADIYVNDAFSVSHREHASIVGVPRLIPGYVGPLLAREIEELSKAFTPPKPFLFILAGAKFDTKLPLVEKFLELADNIFVGGALANDLFKEKGLEVGLSMTAKTPVDLKHIEKNPKLVLPTDVVVTNALARSIKTPDLIGPDETIYDAGPRTISALSDMLSEARFVLWNGTLGAYEMGFSEGTESLAKAIVESGARSVIGGGDTIAAVSKIGILDKFSFVSTGGGAMIEFLAKGTLPGIEVLKRE